MTENTLFCALCNVRCRSQVNFDEHLVSRGHIRSVNRQTQSSQSGRARQGAQGQRHNLICRLCDYAATSRSDLIQHRRSDGHRERLLQRRAEATLASLGPLFERASLLLLHADPPIDLRETRHSLGGLSSKLRELGLGFACITCLKEQNSLSAMRKYLHNKRSHIYPKESLETEKEMVLGLLQRRTAEGVEVDPAEIEKVTLIFIVKKALLIKLFP